MFGSFIATIYNICLALDLSQIRSARFGKFIFEINYALKIGGQVHAILVTFYLLSKQMQMIY